MLLAEEELTGMAKVMAKYGIDIPSFSRIGGVMANEVYITVFGHMPSSFIFCCFVGYSTMILMLKFVNRLVLLPGVLMLPICRCFSIRMCKST